MERALSDAGAPTPLASGAASFGSTDKCLKEGDGAVEGVSSTLISDALSSAAPKVLTQELGREPFAVFCQDDGFGLRLRIDDPSLFMEQINQIPIEPFPDPTVVMKRERQIASAASANLSVSIS